MDTRRDHRHLPRIAAAAGVAALLVAASACSSSGSSSSKSSGGTATSGATSAVDSKLAAMVPADISKSGVLNVASEVYPPAVIQQGTTITGLDIETTRAIAATLGLKAQFKIVPFDGIVAGLQAGRYQAAAGEIFITSERTAVVTFVQTGLLHPTVTVGQAA